MTGQFEFQISENDIGQRLDSWLAAKSELKLTRSQVQKLISDGQVKVNQKQAKSSYRLKQSDLITLTIPPPQNLDLKPEQIPLEIVFEDKDVIVVNKPRGLVVHPAAGNVSGTLVNALLHHCQDLAGIGGTIRPGIVHRLDKGTSGLMVVAKNDLAQHALAKQFKDRTIYKQYLALVHGEVRNETGRIETEYGRHPVHRKKMAVLTVSAGENPNRKLREAITDYRVIERYRGYTLLSVEIKTGRTHQIRVHLTHLGYPIVGDPLYGHRREEFKVSGPMLHSSKLGFVHPRTGEYLEFYRPAPEDLQAILKKLPKK